MTDTISVCQKKKKREVHVQHDDVWEPIDPAPIFLVVKPKPEETRCIQQYRTSSPDALANEKETWLEYT